jgi:uncharacterized protein (DUF2164 family)
MDSRKRVPQGSRWLARPIRWKPPSVGSSGAFASVGTTDVTDEPIGRFLSMRILTRGGAVLVAAAAAVALTSPKPVYSADHKDAPATIADPASDINDLFTFVDGGRFVMAMTITPFAASTAKFSTATKYVFHTQSGTKFGEYKKSEDVICTFDATQKISCWAGTDDYVTGDASAATGLSSASGKLKVFAGLRADPFYFNLQGFKDAVAAVEGKAASLTFDGAGCARRDSQRDELHRGAQQDDCRRLRHRKRAGHRHLGRHVTRQRRRRLRLCVGVHQQVVEEEQEHETRTPHLDGVDSLHGCDDPRWNDPRRLRRR